MGFLSDVSDTLFGDGGEEAGVAATGGGEASEAVEPVYSDQDHAAARA